MGRGLITETAHEQLLALGVNPVMQGIALNTSATDVARPDKISGADINSICQEVSDGFCLDWVRVCVETLPLETTLPRSFCPSLRPGSWAASVSSCTITGGGSARSRF